MVGISGGVGGGGGGYNYVQDAQPGDPSEGEEWYDTGSNAAYVYDGSAWVEQTVVDHGQLSGVGSNDHHSPPTSTNGGGKSRSSDWRSLASKTVSSYSGHTFSGVAQFVHTVEVSSGSGGWDVDVHFQDGTVKSSTDRSGAFTVSVNDKWIEKVSVYNDWSDAENFSVKAKLTAGVPHSHSI